MSLSAHLTNIRWDFENEHLVKGMVVKGRSGSRQAVGFSVDPARHSKYSSQTTSWTPSDITQYLSPLHVALSDTLVVVCSFQSTLYLRCSLVPPSCSVCCSSRCFGFRADQVERICSPSCACEVSLLLKAWVCLC
eukprot:m.377939 g.377939  ORF g.377939 m.377939 type:complete len:135 (+) comp56193_c0_seq25:427-831(+)